MSTFHKARLAVVLCLLSQFFGCGGSNRGAVKGMVTLDGEPLPSGTIAFLPIDGTQSPSAGESIQGGKYSISADKGPMVGVFRVEIHASRKTGQRLKRRDVPGHPFGRDPEGDVEETVEAIPPEYNKESTLRVEVHSGNNTHDFKLVSSPK